ncbi:protein O-mannosyl-transferase TMTC1-like isoform X2 [Tachypleus tridentatus]|uniref:protein O-mannosyl-transferase TMTC1-like isoform X2 n=1 Tax=Tachypleus tridentatus TaxID=6853 RepID=UPI003FD452F7
MKRPNRGRKISIPEWLDRYTISLLVGLVVLLGFRTWMLRGSLPTFSAQDNPAAFSPCLLTRFLTKTYLVTFNAWLVLFPSNLSYDWQMGSIPLVETIWDKRNLGSIFLFGGIGAIFITSRITVKMRERLLLSMALVVLILPFLPASNLLVTVGFVVAERTLYIPSAGVYILVTHGLHRLRVLSPKATWVCRTSTFFVLTVFVWWTLRRNTVWESRASLFKSGIESVPQNAKVHYNYANLQKDLGNVETAIKHYRIALSKQDKREVAEAFLKRAIDIDPGFAEAYSALASLYAVFGHVNEAEKLHLVALSLSPDNVDALNNYGVFVQNLGREDEAVEFYQRAVRIHPNHTVALLNAARTLRSLKFIDDAEKLYKRALYMEEDPQVMDNLGTLYIKSGRLEEARKLYSKLTQKHGSFLDGKIHYAQLLIQERSFYDAEVLLQSVININATYREAYHQLAILFIETNRTSEGFESILQALRLCHVTDKSCALLYVCHGDLVKDMNDLDTAAQSYTIAIQLDPGIGHAHINLGVIHHLKGRHLQALRHYRTAQNLDPQNPVVLENIEKLKKHQWKKSIRRCAEESECYQTW